MRMVRTGFLEKIRSKKRHAVEVRPRRDGYGCSLVCRRFSCHDMLSY